MLVVCVCACMRVVCLDFGNMYKQRMCKCLGPVQVRRSKCPLLLFCICGQTDLLGWT